MFRSLRFRDTILLLHVVLLVTIAILQGVLWRAIRAADEHAELRQNEQHRTAASCEQILGQLATSSSMLTSQELCPIRFRIRSFTGHSVPQKGPIATLYWRTGRDLVPVEKDDMMPDGTVDFGTNPIGQYRLSMKTSNGMVLTHDFEVVRGTPVDRLIIMPRPTPHGLAARLDIPWPESVQDCPLVALCRFEPAAFVHGEWHWQPNHELEPVTVVAHNSLGDELLDCDDLELFLSEFDHDVHPADEVLVPSNYSRVTQMTFLTCHPEQTGRPRRLVNLGTVHFGGSPATTVATSGGIRHWTTDTPAPMFELVDMRWTLPLPASLVDELLLRRERHAPQISNLQSVTPRGTHSPLAGL